MLLGQGDLDVTHKIESSHQDEESKSLRVRLQSAIIGLAVLQSFLL